VQNSEFKRVDIMVGWVVGGKEGICRSWIGTEGWSYTNGGKEPYCIINTPVTNNHT
jgi:hypothetical protein